MFSFAENSAPTEGRGLVQQRPEMDGTLHIDFRWKAVQDVK